MNRTRGVDVAVVGLGPAGRALTAHCLRHGLSVLAVDPHPERPWRPTYGVWVDEVPDLPETVFRAQISGPELRAIGAHRLDRTYGVLDNQALQAALPLTGATVREAALTDQEMLALRTEARVVVDARGARPTVRTPDHGSPGIDTAPAQTAYGIIVHASDAAPALDGAHALLMDWRTDWALDDSPRGPASFLYAIPLDDELVLLEETCLAATPPCPVDTLKTRLHRRLLARGMALAAIAQPLRRETVFIPLHGRDARPPAGTIAFGTAGRSGHLLTGYSVAHSLTAAHGLAQTLADGDPVGLIDLAGPADAIRAAGLRALLRLDVAGTVALFDAFGAIPADQQRALMSRSASAAELTHTMWAMFTRLPPPARRSLIHATLGPGRWTRP